MLLFARDGFNGNNTIEAMVRHSSAWLSFSVELRDKEATERGVIYTGAYLTGGSGEDASAVVAVVRTLVEHKITR